MSKCPGWRATSKMLLIYSSCKVFIKDEGFRISVSDPDVQIFSDCMLELKGSGIILKELGWALLNWILLLIVCETQSLKVTYETQVTLLFESF